MAAITNKAIKPINIHSLSKYPIKTITARINKINKTFRHPSFIVILL